MFKRLTTKIFLVFSILFLTTIALLAYSFGRIVIHRMDTYILEAFSSRAQIEALEVSRELNRNKSPAEILKSRDMQIISGDGTPLALPPNSKVKFPKAALAGLLPPSGSIVSECQDTSGRAYYCALTFLPEIQAWSLSWTSKSNVVQVLDSIKFTVIELALVVFAISLLLSFAFAQWILHPLVKFGRAAQQVARGEYSDIELPADRTDEVGDFARSFQKMVLDLREREANLAMSAMKLAHSARLASIGQMGASIAHEVKNPLTSMLGYAKILESKTSDPEIKEAAEIILKETERCNQILQQMLRFARNDPKERRPYSLKEVVQSAVMLINAEAKNRKVHLKLENLCDSVLVGSAQQIQQVLLNLLLNAIQASRENSEVLIRSHETDGKVTIEIEDHGTGIPPEVQSKIFDPFFTTKGKREGTGLGLSVAWDIVHDQGGEITFLSKPGSGTAFQIQLPIDSRAVG